MRPYNAEYFQRLTAYITDYQERFGSTPTLAEAERDTGIPKSTVARYIKYMLEHHLLESDGRHIFTREMLKKRDRTVSVPVLGAIACGIPKYAEENIEEYVHVSTAWLGTGDYFALRADGESMLKAGISHGDLVLVHKQDYAEPGQIIVALINDENATLKRYYPNAADGYIDLVPENDAFPVQRVNLSVNTFAVQGVAVKVLKDLS